MDEIGIISIFNKYISKYFCFYRSSPLFALVKNVSFLYDHKNFLSMYHLVWVLSNKIKTILICTG